MARRIRVPLSFAFAAIYIWMAKPSATSIAVGTLVVIPGIVLRAVASGHIQKNEELTTSGPYAYTRNPLYLGSFIMAVGFCIAARSVWLAAATLLMFFIIYVPVMWGEEAYLRERFSQFEEYARHVPRFLPRPFAVGRTGESFSLSLSFSWDLYRKHREYNAIPGSLAIMAALAAKLVWFSR